MRKKLGRFECRIAFTQDENITKNKTNSGSLNIIRANIPFTADEIKQIKEKSGEDNTKDGVRKLLGFGVN